MSMNQKIRGALYTVERVQLHSGIAVVLDLHRADRSGEPEPDGRCCECAEVSPCPTVVALAKAVGVGEDR